MEMDIRWQQRFQNYRKALSQLQEATDLSKSRELSKLEKQGLIQRFEYTYELAWNTLKDYLTYLGIAGLIGSRDSIREAFNRNLVDDGQIWMEMLKDRNRSAHTYNEEIAEEIVKNILSAYIVQFQQLEKTFSNIEHSE
ncbi:MAG: nucleotidyltransferase [Deltaproteobacteria bacterium]|nr:nucleotidyltransferase [Deltaproteobacteria bacterium]